MWQDRLQEARYTNSQGDTTGFRYTVITETTERKGTKHVFPQTDGALLIDQGVGSTTYPLSVLFDGDDYDRDVAEFVRITSVKGVGVLQLPLHQAIPVVVQGTITRSDDMVDEASFSRVSVTFEKTLEETYPVEEIDGGATLDQGVEDTTAAIAEEVDTNLITDAVALANKAQSAYRSVLKKITNALDVVARVQAGVKQAFDTIESAIDAGLSTLIGTPLLLAFETMRLVQLPGTIIGNIGDKLSGYKNLFDSIVSGEFAGISGGSDGVVTDELIEARNEFALNDMVASSSIVGMVVSSINHQFTTEQEALQAAQTVQETYDAYVVWRERQQTSLGLETSTTIVVDDLDDGQVFITLTKLVQDTRAFLVQVSFDVRQGNTYTTEGVRHPIELMVELTGRFSEADLDFFMDSNNMSPTEVLRGLQRGREIVYFV